MQPFLNKVHDLGQGESASVEGGESSKMAEDSSPVEKLRSILSGERPFALYLEFLFSHNHARLVAVEASENLSGVSQLGLPLRHRLGERFDARRNDVRQVFARKFRLVS